MGLEASCEACYRRRRSPGKLRLEEDGIHFRGSFRLDIPVNEITAVETASGDLSVAFGHEIAVFVLGVQAEKWALKIRSPRSRAQKLGLRTCMRIAFVGAPDEQVLEELHAEGISLTPDLEGGGLDLIFYRMCHLDDLRALTDMKKAIQPAGAIWILAPKGSKLVRESDVLNDARTQGLSDVKVVAYSATLTAHKMVPPLSARQTTVKGKGLQMTSKTL